MNDRITKGIVERQVMLLNRRLGRPLTYFDADKKIQVGHLTLDHGPAGFRVEEIDNSSGSVSCPFGYEAHTLRELYAILRAAHGLLDCQEMGFPLWVNVPIKERVSAV